MDIVNADFASLPDNVRRDFSIRKQILGESKDCSEEELTAKEVECIGYYESHDPNVGDNRWPNFK